MHALSLLHSQKRTRCQWWRMSQVHVCQDGRQIGCTAYCCAPEYVKDATPPPFPPPLSPLVHACWPWGACVAGSRTVSANQEIHNYYEEVSTHIKYKLNEFKGLSAAWQQTQNANKAVDQAQALLLHAHEQVSSKHTLSHETLQQQNCVSSATTHSDMFAFTSLPLCSPWCLVR